MKVSGYDNITYWENERRIRLLRKFCEHVSGYVEHSSYNHVKHVHREDAEAKNARREINFMMEKVYGIVDVTHDHRGPYGSRVRELLYIFDHFVKEDMIVDLLQRAIGVYEGNRRKSLGRTFNPFWWLDRVIRWFVRLPFDLLGAVGLDSDKIEVSWLGKIVKFIFALIPVIAAFLTILYYVGWLAMLKNMFGIHT